jgi:hypothetical protein
VALHPVIDANSVGNVILVATEGALPEKLVLEENWARLRATSPRAPDLRVAIRHRWERPIPFDDVPLLTDGYAPTDALLVG